MKTSKSTLRPSIQSAQIFADSAAPKVLSNKRNRRMGAGACLIAMFAQLLLTQPLVRATDYTWNGGGGDNNWGTGTNWIGGGSPATSTTNNIHFAGSTRTSPFMNYTNFDNFQDIIFDSGASSFNVTGNSLDIFGKIENQSSNLQTWGITSFSFNSSTRSELDPTSGDLTINLTGSGDNLFNNGNTIHVFGNTGHTLTLTANTHLQGTGALINENNNIIVISGTNSYSGSTTIKGGEINFTNGGSAINTSFFLGDTTGSQNATFTLSGTGQSFANAMTVQAGNSGTQTLRGTNVTGTNSYTGTITVNNALTLSAASGGTLLLNTLTNSTTAQTLTTTGSGGTVFLSGNVDNTFMNATVSSGTLVLGKTSTGSVHAVGANTGATALTVNAGATAKLAGSGGDQIFNQGSVVVSGTFDLNGNSEGIELLSGTGTVTNNSTTTTGTLTVGAGNSAGTTSSTFSGKITDNATGTLTLIKSGSSTLSLAGTSSTYRGTTTITNGGAVNGGLYAGGLSIAGDGSLGAAPGSLNASALTIDGGNLTITQTGTISANRGITVTTAGGAITDSGAGTQNLTINSPVLLQTQGGIQHLFVESSDSTTFVGLVSGTGDIVKEGPGTLTLSGSNSFGNTATGVNIYIDSGTVQTGNASGLGVATGTIALGPQFNNAQAGNSSLMITGTGTTVANAIQVRNFVPGFTKTIGSTNVTGNATYSGAVVLNDNVTLTSASGGTTIFTGVIQSGTANGAVTISGTGSRVQLAPSLVTTAASAISGTNVLTVTNNNNFYIGQGVSGNGIASGAYVTGTTGTSVTISANTTAAIASGTSVTFTGNIYSGGTTLNSGTLVLANNNTAASGGVVQSGLLGTGTFTINGGGISAAVGNNPSLVTPTTVITTGTVALDLVGTRITLNANNVNITGTTTFSITSTGASPTFATVLAASGGSSVLRTGVVTGSPSMNFNGGLVLDGSGLTTVAGFNITGANNFTGNSALTIGNKILLNGNGTFGSGTNAPNLTVNSGGYVFLTSGTNASNNLEVYSLSGSGSVANVSTTGGIGTLNISGTGANLGNFAGNIVDGSSLNATTSLVSTGTTALTKSGTLSTQTLSGINTYSGTTTISGGTLQVTGTAALSSASNLLGSSTTGNLATLSLGSGSYTMNQFVGQNMTISGTVGGASLTFTNGGSSLQGNKTLTTGTGITVFINGSTFDIGTAANTGASFASNGSTVINAQVINTGTLTSKGSGILTLSGSNTFSGGVIINSGTLNYGNLNALGTGTTQFSGNSVLQAALSGTLPNNILIQNATIGTIDTQANTVTLGGIVSGTGTSTGALTKAGSGTLISYGTNSYTGATTITSGTLQLGSGSTGQDGVIASTSIVNNGVLVLNNFNTANISSSAVISGSGSLTKSGAGPLTLAAANTYTGGSTLNSGTVVLGVATVVTSGTITSGPLGTGTLTIGNGTNSLNIQTNATNATTRTLSNAINLNGDTTFSTSAATGRIALNTINGLTVPNTITLNRTNTLTAASTMTMDLIGAIGGGNFGLNLTGGATWNIGSTSAPDTVANTYTGLTDIQQGNLTLNKAASTDAIAGDLQIDAGATLTLGANNENINNGSAVTVSGTFALNGKTETIGSLNVTGGTVSSATGNLIIAGAGSTTVSSGTVSVNNLTTGSGTLTLGSGALVSSITSLNGNVAYTGTLAGATFGTGAISLNGARNFTVATGTSGLDLTVSGIVSDGTAAGSITKLGTGTMLLNKANTYTGGTTLSNGVLRLGSSSTVTTGTLVSGPVGTGLLTLGGGTLQDDGTARTLSNNISVTGSTIFSSSTGNTNITLSGSLTSGAPTIALNVVNPTLTVNTGTLAISDIIRNGSGNSLTKDGNGMLSLSPSYTTTGFTAISGTNVLNMSGTAAVYIGQGVSGFGIASGAYVTGTTGTTVTISANTTQAITSGSNYAFFGNTYSGTTTINAGTLKIGAVSSISSAGVVQSGATGTGSVILANGVSIDASSGNTWAMPQLTTSGTITLVGGNRLILALGTWDFGGGTTLAVNSKSHTIASGTITGGSESTGQGSWEVGILNSGTITAQNGNLILSSTFAGANYGTIMFKNGINFAAGGTQTVDIGSNVEFMGSLGLSGSTSPALIVENGGIWNLQNGARNAWSLSGSGAIVSSLVSNTSGTNTLQISGTSGTATFAGTINDNVTGTSKIQLSKTGGLTQILTGTNNYSGGTLISSGTLQVTGTAALSSNSYLAGAGSTAVGATLSLGSAANYTVASFGTKGTELQNLIITGSAGAVLTGTNGGVGTTLNTTANKILQVDPGITVNINGGIFDISGTAGAHTMTFDSRGVTNINSLITGTTGSNTVAMTGTGILNLTGSNNWLGGLQLQSGTVNYSNLNALSTGTTNFAGNSVLQSGTAGTLANNMTINNGVTATVDTNGNATTFSGIISGTGTQTGALTKVGANTLTLTGSSSYIGTTTVSAGTLQLGDGTTGNDGAVSSGTIANAAALVFNRFGASSYAGVISGTGSVTKTGAGTQTLSGSSTYTGVTTISQGVLSVNTIKNGGVTGSIGAAAVAAGNLVFDGGTLQYTGTSDSTNRNFTITSGSSAGFDITTNTLTWSGAAASTTGGLTKSGTGTLILTGNNLYTGATTVNAGRLTTGGNAIADTSAVVMGTATTAEFFLNNDENVGSLAGGNATGGSVNLNGKRLGIGSDNTSTSYAGVITGGASSELIKTGTGTQTLTGASTFGSGGNSFVRIGNGTLALSGSGSLTNVQTIVTGTAAGSTAKFDVTGVTGGTYNVASGQKLMGGGTVVGNVSVGTGATLAPGNSPGTLSQTGNMTYASGGTYQWEVNNATGTKGVDPGWDWNNITGTLTIGATSGSTFTIDITGLNTSNVAGSVSNWDPTTNYSWIIASASSGISGFAANKFTLQTTNFTSNNSVTGAFGITTSGNDLVLTYTAPIANDSQLAITPSPVNLGKVFNTYSNSAIATGTVTNNGTTGNADWTTSATGNATVSGTGSGLIPSGTSSITVGSNGGISAALSGTNVTIGTVTANNTTRPAGTSPAVNVVANVYEQASLTTGTTGFGGASNTLQLTNATPVGGLRAGVTVNTVTPSGVSTNYNVGLSGTPSVGDTTSGALTSTVASVSIKSDRLNGSYSTGGTVTGAISYTDATLAAQATVANKTWTVSASTTVTGATSSGTSQVRYADVANGANLTGYGLGSATNQFSPNTAASILNSGTTTSATTVSMAFDTATNLSLAGTAPIASDVLILNGAGASGAYYVLQLSYSAATLASLAPGAIPYIGFWTGSAWVNAADGSTNGSSALQSAYTGTLLAGVYGYDPTTQQAWAVISNPTYSGDFAVIPEPGTYAMAVGGFGMLIAFQRMRRRKKQ